MRIAADKIGPLLAQGKQVVLVSGAGLSAASGLPVYRHAPDAIWETSLREWGTRAAFASDPVGWWRGYEDRGYARLTSARPNAGHDAVAALTRHYPTMCVVTQNVDGLHWCVPAAQLVEVHGTAHRLKCIASGCPHASTTTLPDLRGRSTHPPGHDDCGHVNGAAAADVITADGAKPVQRDEDPKKDHKIDDDGHKYRLPPKCPLCDGPLCAAFLLFDEDYESHTIFQWDKALRWLSEADAFVFVGTSFAVGVTAEALMQAQRRKVPCFSFNPVVPEALRRKRGLDLTHVLGRAEDTLPKLAALLLNHQDMTSD